MKVDLTVIITFLNEGEEVRNTVSNLIESSDYPFDIILINDASTDDYDYSKIAKDFKVSYVVNKSRLGVAESRNKGVSLCKTKYFLLLDAHMRVYQRDWVKIIIDILNKESKCIICGSTLNLNEKGEVKNQTVGYGAYFNFKTLKLEWVSDDNYTPTDKIEEIPCILGASYACSKYYWEYLRGLEGLKSYGLDEQFISIKVWLDGGKCFSVNSIKFGHIFRTVKKVPYSLPPKDFIKNILLITELFYSFKMKINLIKSCRYENGENETTESILELDEESITSMKKYYADLFPNSIDYLKKINSDFISNKLKK